MQLPKKYSLVPYLELQSTLGYLKSPPEGYLIPGFDVMGGMQQIRDKVLNGGYAAQYDFVWELRNIVGASTPLYPA